MSIAKEEGTPAGSRGVAWLVAGAFFMEMLDATVITTALPEMARSFGVRPADMVKIVSGDFVHDGHDDLIGIDASGTSFLFPSASATTWGAPTGISALWGSFRDLAVGKVNNDDYDDLLLINGSGTLIEYPGRATGGLGAAVNLSTAFADYRDLTIGKLVGDTYNALFAVQNSTGQWKHFPGQAAGGFNLSSPTQSGTGQTCCKQNTFGKFNDDDYLDLVAVEVASGKLKVYTGTATGSLVGGFPDPNAGANWLNREVASLHSEVTGRDSIMAKDLPTGNLNIFQSVPNGIDWADPISYGRRA